jgi:uncharacterized protein YcfJ
MQTMKRIAFVAMMALSLSASAQNRTDNILGTLIGGAVGGAAGSQVGKGNGRTAAIIGGTMLGAYVGDRVTSPSQPQPQQQRGYQQSSYQQAYQQPTRSQPIMSSRDAQQSYDNNEVITDDQYNDRRVVRQPVRQVRQVREVQHRAEKYYYTVQTESGRTVQMVGCAAYDEREGASRPVDMRQCEGPQTAYQNY